MFTETLFIITQTKNNPNAHQEENKQRNKLKHIHAMKDYPAVIATDVYQVRN